MKELLQLQNQLQNYLLSNDETIKENIIGTEQVSLETRLGVYKNAYQIRLMEGLAANYPILKSYLGDDTFAELAQGYFKKYPSTFRSIRWCGDQLTYYLTQDVTYQQYAYLAELATFEWTMTLVFDASDAQSISLETIGALARDTWEKMRFALHPSIYFLSLQSNAVAIWQALAQEAAPPDPEEAETPVTWICWRENLITRFCSLPIDEAWAIQAIASDATFGEMCEGLCQWVNEENAALHAASLLKGWVMGGLITHVFA